MTAHEAERDVARPAKLGTVWETLMADARSCTRCDLCRHSAQTVLEAGSIRS